MQVFDVLDPNLNVLKPFLLEASAGTGKTFSIENIVVRALLQENDKPISIKDILVVTFTKAAAKDLKVRIFQNLQKTATVLENPEDLRKIKRALVEFDHANISTIHAFCYRALAEHATVFRLKKNPEDLSQDIIWKVLEKHFHTRLTIDAYTPAQVNILTRRGIVKLAEDLISAINRGSRFSRVESNTNWEPLSGELFEKYAYHFYGLTEGKTKTLKKEYIDALNEQNGEILKELLPLFARENLKKSVPFPPENVLVYFDEIQKTVVPVLNSLWDYDFLLARLAAECQKAVFAEFEATETCDFSYLLLKMDQLITNDPDFKTRLKNRYRMVIIDEFQDTDPLQWKMFKELFSDGTFPFILVGDPKQSIYAFRSADIYTYLDAANSISSKFLLDTNYRSTPELISALNTLFEAASGWMALPHFNTNLPYIPVHAPSTKAKGIAPAVHFLHIESKEKLNRIEEDFLFPYFLNEVQHLQKTGIPLSAIAFLVRDRKQSARLLSYFQSKELPAIQLRSLQLEQAVILQDLIHLLRAIASPRRLSFIQVALGTQFFNWQTSDFKQLDDQDLLGKILLHFHEWLRIWKKVGIAGAIEAVLFRETIQKGLLQTDGGLERYHELRQIIEWLAIREAEDRLNPFGTIEELESIQHIDHPHQENMKLRPLVDQDAVQILTLHMSKGLEYEAVFVPGVIVRSPQEKGLILAREDENLVLKPVAAKDPALLKFLEESDAEKSRQLYVALTRAKSKLYIPIIEGWKAPLLGQAAPLELWLARIGEPACSWRDLYTRLTESRLPFLQALTGENVVLEKLEARDAEKYISPNPILEILAPKPLMLQFPKFWNLSFTGLSKTTVSRSFQEDASDLPRGSYTGEFLHQLLEEIPFSTLRNAMKAEDLKGFIHSYTSKTQFEPWETRIAEMIFKAFKTPITELGITLDQITEELSFREMEFIYPAELAQFLPECRNLQGNINGVIDLFFTLNGKCYLLDWKSNWLESYTHDQLKQAMLDNRYDLQADLYEKALTTYLSNGFSLPFGGTIYYFLRGNAYFIYKKGEV